MTKLSADELRNLAIGADDTNTRCSACGHLWASGEKTPHCGSKNGVSSPVTHIEVEDKYGASIIVQMMCSAGMHSPQKFMNATCADCADRAGFDLEKVSEMLQRFKVGSPPLTSPVRRLAEHAVRLEARFDPDYTEPKS